MTNLPGVENPAEFDRIHVTFKDQDEGMAGESVWAQRLRDGDNPSTGVYEVKNVPYFARGFTIGDKVVCDEAWGMERIPEITAVIERHGYISVAILFGPNVTSEPQTEVLAPIEKLGAITERATGTFVVAAVTDAVFTDGVEAILDKAHAEGLLDYEVAYPDENDLGAS